MWAHIERVIKPSGVTAITSSQPFTTKLINSNPEMFTYDWIWFKGRGSDFLNANRKPLKSHEEICIFYRKSPTYNPQFWYSIPYKKTMNGRLSDNYGDRGTALSESKDGKRYPLTVIEFSRDDEGYHPTQKPVPLFEYLIKTYTKEGDLVLDFAAGSGTTGVACQNTDRDFIMIEKESEYIDVIRERLEDN